LAEGLGPLWCHNLGRMVSKVVIRKAQERANAGRTCRGHKQKRLFSYINFAAGYELDVRRLWAVGSTLDEVID